MRETITSRFESRHKPEISLKLAVNGLHRAVGYFTGLPAALRQHISEGFDSLNLPARPPELFPSIHRQAPEAPSQPFSEVDNPAVREQSDPTNE